MVRNVFRHASLVRQDMIRAHMATYPARRPVLRRAVQSIARQVDRVYLVLNEYAEVPEEIADLATVEAILPGEDLKDVGKFLPEAGPDDLVFLADDDIHYEAGYVQALIAAGEGLGLDRAVVGLHGSIYGDVAAKGPMDRSVHAFFRDCRETIRVDQLGTGVMMTLGRNLAPLGYMAGSQKFVDVRYAAWLQARGVASWCIGRDGPLASQLVAKGTGGESIFKTFTRRNPKLVAAEILRFAGKAEGIGEVRAV